MGSIRWIMTIDALFQNTTMFSTKKKRTIQPGDALEDTAFKRWLEIVKL
jgi:hypothetical protein